MNRYKKYQNMNRYRKDKNMLRRFLRLYTSIPNKDIRKMSYKKIISIADKIAVSLDRNLYLEKYSK